MGRSTVRYEISAIRNESILAIKEFIDKRLEVDRNASKAFTPFTKFISTEEEIKSVHQPFAPDLELANLAIEFQDLQDVCGYNVRQSLHSAVKNCHQG